MRTALPAAAIAVALLAAASPAFAQSHHHGHAPAAPAADEAPSTRAYKAADEAMMRAMGVPYTGDPDVDFRTHMIPHHQGAIDMARVALQHAKDPETRRLAEAIIADQEREIAEMRAWLKARGR